MLNCYTVYVIKDLVLSQNLSTSPQMATERYFEIIFSYVSALLCLVPF